MLSAWKPPAEKQGLLRVERNQVLDTNRPYADTLVVYAKPTPTAKPQRRVQPSLSSEEWRVQLGPKLDKLGIRGSGTCELVFDNSQGLMQACCDTAFAYAHERKQFGTKIGRSPAHAGKDGGYVNNTAERLPYVYVLRGTRLRRGTLQQQGLCRGVITVLRWEVYSGCSGRDPDPAGTDTSTTTLPAGTRGR